MKKILIAASLFLFTTKIIAQNVEADKATGLVKVDGKDAFYLLVTQKRALNFDDYSFCNLNKKELATFVTNYEMEYNDALKQYTNTGRLKIIFKSTGNNGIFKNIGLGAFKSLSKMLAKAKLININGDIDADAERSFIVMLNGNFIKDPNTPSINLTVNTPASSATTFSNKDVLISIKQTKIYNQEEVIGTFKSILNEDKSLLTIKVYNAKDEIIATATHNEKQADADWVIKLSTGTTKEVLYNASTPLEKLFKYLVEKDILK